MDGWMESLVMMSRRVLILEDRYGMSLSSVTNQQAKFVVIKRPNFDNTFYSFN